MSYNLLIDGEVVGPVDGIEATLEDGTPQLFKSLDLKPISVTPLDSEYTIKASDYGKDGYSEVTVYAIEGDYVGKDIPRKAAATITPTEVDQQIDAGQYLDGKQTIKAIPTTYIGSGVSRKAAATITPTEIDQQIDAGQYLDGAQTIKAIPTTYIGSGVSRKAAATITPTESKQTIPAGQYLEGALTINPIPSNYIDTNDLLIHCTQQASGTFVGSGQTPDKLSIGISFRAKVILIMATNPITTSNTASPYEIAGISRVYNDSFGVIRDTCVFVYKSGSSAKSGHTASAGLRGNADNTITGWGTAAKFASGTTYTWYAWG